MIFRNSVPRLDSRMDLLSYTLIDSKNTFFELLGFITTRGQRSDFYGISRILAKLSTSLKSSFFIVQKRYLHHFNRNSRLWGDGDTLNQYIITIKVWKLTKRIHKKYIFISFHNDLFSLLLLAKNLGMVGLQPPGRSQRQQQKLWKVSVAISGRSGRQRAS